MAIIAYTYDADYHCLECAEQRFGINEDGEICGTDSEGNEIHPVFSSDEWYANEMYAGERHAVLGCGSCGATIEEIDLDAA